MSKQLFREKIKELTLELVKDWYQYEDEHFNIYETPASWQSFCTHDKVKTRLERIDHLIDKYVAGVIGEDEAYVDTNRSLSTDVVENAGIGTRNKLKAEQRRRAGIGEK